MKIKLRSSEIELPAHVSFYLVFFLADKHIRLAKGTCRLGRSGTLMGIYVYLVEEYYMACSSVPRNPDETLAQKRDWEHQSARITEQGASGRRNSTLWRHLEPRERFVLIVLPGRNIRSSKESQV